MRGFLFDRGELERVAWGRILHAGFISWTLPDDGGMTVVAKETQRGGIGRGLAMMGRVLGWGLLGGVCGIVLGLINGVIHAPPDVPGDELAHEWYTVGVMIITAVECLGGFFFGAGIALGAPRRHAGARCSRSHWAGRFSGRALGGFCASVSCHPDRLAGWFGTRVEYSRSSVWCHRWNRERGPGPPRSILVRRAKTRDSPRAVGQLV